MNTESTLGMANKAKFNSEQLLVVWNCEPLISVVLSRFYVCRVEIKLERNAEYKKQEYPGESPIE